MLDSVLKLIGVTWAKDATGVLKETITAREVFCSVSSVTRQEFFDGGRSGLNPSFQFTVFAGDYVHITESLMQSIGHTDRQDLIISNCMYREKAGRMAWQAHLDWR